MRSIRHPTDTTSTFGEMFCDFDAVKGPEVALSLRIYLDGEIDWGFRAADAPDGFCWATSIDPTPRCQPVPECYTKPAEQHRRGVRARGVGVATGWRAATLRAPKESTSPFHPLRTLTHMGYGPCSFHRMGHVFCSCGWSGKSKSSMLVHLRTHPRTEVARSKVLREIQSMWNQASREGRESVQ